MGPLNILHDILDIYLHISTCLKVEQELSLQGIHYVVPKRVLQHEGGNVSSPIAEGLK